MIVEDKGPERVIERSSPNEPTSSIVAPGKAMGEPAQPVAEVRMIVCQNDPILFHQPHLLSPGCRDKGAASA